MINYRGKKIFENDLVFNNRNVKTGKEITKTDLFSKLKEIGNIARFENSILDLSERLNSIKDHANQEQELRERAELERLLKKYK